MTDGYKITDVRDLFAILLKRKWLIVFPWILVAALAYGGSYLLTPQYEAFSIVSVDPDVRLSGDLQRLLGMDDRFRTSNTQRASQLQALHNEVTSTNFVRQLDDRLRLSDNPALQLAIDQAFLAQQQQGHEISRDVILMTMLQGQMKDAITVSFAGEDQLRFTVGSPSPAKARDISNTIAEIFIQEKMLQELSSLRSSQDFSDVQLRKYEKQVQDLVERKTRLERAFLDVQIDDAVVADANRTDIRSEIDRTANDIEEYQSIEKDALSHLNSVTGINVARLGLTESERMSESLRDLNRELTNYGRSLVQYSWSDGQMGQLRIRQASLLNEIEVETERLVADQFADQESENRTVLTTLFNARANLDYHYARKAKLEVALNELNERISSLPEYQAQLDQVNRELAAATELRDKFKEQIESSNINQALLQDISTSKYRKVEPAKLPLAPVSPNRIRILAMGILLGLIIGGAAALLAELFDQSFKRVEDVETSLGVPVLGVVPNVPQLRRVPNLR